MSYKHLEIEEKWQQVWDEKKVFFAETLSTKPKYYILDMFPYPSASGLHVGHPEGYTATDMVARFKRAKGFNVLHPMGWDAFGLPAEQYAIKTGVHPQITTNEAMVTFKRQLKSFGFSFDWSREISTCDPQYYKWTQYIFTKLYEKGLAYQKEVPVNWCPALKTVLANEEVVDGKSERGGHPIVRIPMKQWMLKITAYAERLLSDLEKVDWPERTKDGQRNWIGKSEGANIHFNLLSSDPKTSSSESTASSSDPKTSSSTETLEVFTTRPDTLFGVTFMVIAPEHPLVEKITTAEKKLEVTEYQKRAARKSDVDRQKETEKTGVFTGAFAEHPFLKENDQTKQKIQIWISDYVMMGYGTGAIMAVPAHDERDFAFAKKFSLPIIQVIEMPEGQELPYAGDGKVIHSEFLNGLNKSQAISAAIQKLEQLKMGQKTIHYKFRDWLFSRQRYWGEPFPIIKYANGKMSALSLDELPVTLPQVADYEPSEKGESPLGRNKEWVKTKDKSGNPVERETDTMPGSAGSSWYFLRYTDPQNNLEPFSFAAQKYWMPVDLYLGGPEHTVGHLLYARFWQKVLFDAGLVSHDEPFKKLVHQGMILGDDGEKMSKSRGNVINPDTVIEKYGADSLRLYLMFMGPLDKDKPWSDTGIQGARRFLDRVWRLCFADEDDSKVLADDRAPSAELLKLTHKTIAKVTHDIENLSVNTAISQMMILVNEMYKLQEQPRSVLLNLAQLFMPYAPHLAEEIWSKLGGEGLVSLAPWPTYDPKLIVDNVVTMGVQVNGKMRGTIEITKDASQEQVMLAAMQVENVTRFATKENIQKIIYVPGKILNLIVK